MVVEFSENYLMKLVRKFNRLGNIPEEEINFIINEAETEQVRIIERWLGDKIGDKTAKERIKALRWVIRLIRQTQKSGKSASERLESLNTPPQIS